MAAHAILALVFVLGGAPAADLESVLRPAMGPYYAALAASHHGNIEATQRQLLLFEAHWDVASRQARVVGPEALLADPDWARALDFGTEALGRAKAAMRAKDVHAAHGELESIRLHLREVRARHKLESIDDRLTNFHEALERLVARISEPNEILLTAADWDAIGPQAEAVRALFLQIDANAPPSIRRAAGWGSALTALRGTLADLEAAVAKRNAVASSMAAEQIHNRYLELIVVLSKV